MIIIYYLLELLFPRKCIFCRAILPRNALDMCPQCRVNAPEFPFSGEKERGRQKLTLRFLDSYTAVWYYEEKVRNSILRYKFHRGFHLVPAFGRFLSMRIRREFEDGFDVITWVPVSRRRKWQRSFDQSELLCRAVARELGVKPVRLLHKIRHNPPQSSTERANRKGNVLGAYKAVNEADIRGKRVLLIDDIVTSGATADECAMMLVLAGAKEVKLACLAAAQKREKTTKEWMV